MMGKYYVTSKEKNTCGKSIKCHTVSGSLYKNINCASFEILPVAFNFALCGYCQLRSAQGKSHSPAYPVEASTEGLLRDAKPP